MGKAKAKRGKKGRQHQPAGPVGAVVSTAAAAGGAVGRDGKALPPLFQKLSSTDDNERLNGCQAIAHLAADGQQNIIELRQCDIFEMLRFRTRDMSIPVLTWLCYICRYGIFEMLGARLVDSVKEVQVAAAGALTNLLTEGGGEAAHAMLVSGALGTVVSQLQAARLKPVEQILADGANPAHKLQAERVKRQEEFDTQKE